MTFDRDMGGGMSWTGGGPDYPRVASRPHWLDSRTCVLPVTLETGKYYRVGINSTSHQNFRSASGYPAQPSAIYFTTVGASAELEAQTRKPAIVSFDPPNGAAGVDPNVKEIRITFNVAMGGGFSWTGGDDVPPCPEGRRPYWTPDRKTCVRPVALQPQHTYRVGLNSPSHKNFQSEGGVPLDPVRYQSARSNLIGINVGDGSTGCPRLLYGSHRSVRWRVTFWGQGYIMRHQGRRAQNPPMKRVEVRSAGVVSKAATIL